MLGRNSHPHCDIPARFARSIAQFYFFALTINIPVIYAARKMRVNGIYVPRGLRNISRLLLIINATRKKSMKITMKINKNAVRMGEV